MKPVPLPPLSPADRRAALEISTAEGMLANAHAALSGNIVGGNTFSYGYAILLGATNAHLGVLTALPQLAALGQTIAAWLLQRIRSRRRLVVAACLVSRSVFFVAPALPFVIGRDRALWVFMALFGLAALAHALAANGWTSWMADIVPPSVRGRYFSRRNNLCNMVGLSVGLLGAVALDAWSGERAGVSAEADARRLAGFCAVFGAAALAGGLSTRLLARQPEPERKHEDAAGDDAAPASLATLLLTPFRDPGFRAVLLFLTVFSFVNGLGNPFWAAFVLEDLEQSYGFLTFMGLLNGLAGLATLPLWGRLIDRFGARPCMAISIAVGATHPLYFLIATPTFTLPIWADAISSGIMWGGYNLAVFNMLIAITPARRGREMFFAAQAGTAGIALAASSILAGALADMMPGGRRTLFLAVSALRVCSLVLLARIEEPGARPLRQVLGSLRRAPVGR